MGGTGEELRGINIGVSSEEAEAESRGRKQSPAVQEHTASLSSSLPKQPILSSGRELEFCQALEAGAGELWVSQLTPFPGQPFWDTQSVAPSVTRARLASS